MNLAAIILAVLIADAPPEKPAVNYPPPYPPSTWFQSDPAPEDVTPTGNPLDWAGAKIGLDVRNYELPRGWEGEYRFCCRFPIIDAVANRPLYIKRWTEESAQALLRADGGKGLGQVTHAIEMALGSPYDGSYPYGPEGPEKIRLVVKEFQQAVSHGGFTKKYITSLTDLFRAYCIALEIKWDNEGTDVQPEDLEYIEKNRVAFLLPDGKKMNDLTGNNDVQMEYISHLRSWDLTCNLYGTQALTDGVAKYIKQTTGFKLADFYADTSRSRETFSWTCNLGTIVISGFDNKLHTETATLLIDLGGDDEYRNSAGGTIGRVALCLDHSGNDLYDSRENPYVHGCGVLGIGMLVDLEGNDAYYAKHFAQGAGIAGVGVLYDRSGNDFYCGQGFTQGAAMFGLGMLIDDAGDDTYGAATLSQGGATTLGIGILCDRSGNDQYRLAVDKTKDAFGSLPGYGQGGALSFRPSPWRGKFTPYGGVGMLIDGEGNDDYVTDGWCDQGGSYIMSLGALYDGAGNDHYKANTGQGSGIHITNAILVDKGGNDVYEGGFRSGGSGGDRSVGMLLDYAGNDAYKSGSSSYGTGCKPYSYSLMIDYCGDDTFTTANPVGPILFNCWDSFGGVWPESALNLYPWAICLDLGGKDAYQVRNRRNNSVRQSFGHGITVDMDWKGGDVIGKVENLFPPLDSAKLQLASGYDIAPWGKRGVAEIGLFDLRRPFDTFHAIGLITSQPRGALEPLIDRLLTSEDRSFNRDGMEAIHVFLVEKRFPITMLPKLLTLLKAKDAEIRLMIADDIGVFALAGCDADLVSALDDPDPQVRRFAYRSMSSLKSPLGLDEAQTALKNDPSEDVRRVSLGYISSMTDKSGNYQPLIDRLMNDRASSVRVAAADAIARLGYADALETLRHCAQTDDVYLQRAIAKALCELGDVEGIGMLIESLTFPSIDAFYNYDYNVPNFISTYSGHDFPDPDRYDQQKWREWFAANKDKIDLKGNIAASRAYTALTESLRGASDSTMIVMMEAFLSAHPKHRNAASTLATQLNRIAWDMATAPKDNPRYNPTKAIEYSKRACELAPDPNYWDTYAEALFARGKYAESAKVCEEQLKRSPGNKMFVDRLGKINDRMNEMKKEIRVEQIDLK